jgi:hypothetical protein
MVGWLDRTRRKTASGLGCVSSPTRAPNIANRWGVTFSPTSLHRLTKELILFSLVFLSNPAPSRFFFAKMILISLIVKSTKFLHLLSLYPCRDNHSPLRRAIENSRSSRFMLLTSQATVRRAIYSSTPSRYPIPDSVSMIFGFAGSSSIFLRSCPT